MRDLSVAELERRLAERGCSDAEVADAIEALLRTGLLDDARLAERRAAALADRGEGDALIRHRLRTVGLDDELVEEAVGRLEPESERARGLAARRGGATPRVARYLAGKGFGEDSIRAVVAMERGGELG